MTKTGLKAAAAAVTICAAGLSLAVAQDAAPQSVARAQLEARGLERQDGFLPAYLDERSGSFIVEVSADILGQDVLAYSVTERGQETDLFLGIPDQSLVVRLEERRGGRLDIVQVDPSIAYAEDNPLSRRGDAVRPKTILGTARVLTAEGEGDTRTLFVDGTALFRAASGGRIPAQNARGRPVPAEVMSIGIHPDNVDVVFETDEVERRMVRFPWEGEPKTVRLEKRVSLVRLPDLGGYEPRLADDRIGYFHADITDPGRFGRETTDHYLRRFDLRKKDPSAAVSEPVEPIVFWMENSTPLAFRGAVREAVLSWNEAFEAAGFKDAIVVRQMPDDADWSPGDIRYNVLRWVAKDFEFLYGAGPSVYDPRTGETLGADIYMGYSLFAGRLNVPADIDSVRTGRIDPGFDDTEPSEAVLQKVRNTVAHEVGHTLGLRHNFRASGWLTFDQYRAASALDRQATASIMDYMPVHIAEAGTEQGRYIDGAPGPYDVWAIQFGYHPGIDTDERREAHLRRQAEEPAFAYASDEHVLGRLGIDPRVQTRDASSDPVRYAEHQVKTARQLMGELLAKQAETGVARGAFRDAFALAKRQRAGAALTAARFVGGVYVDPLVPDAPRSGAVYTPVPRAAQQAALAVAAEAVFRPGAFDEDVAIAPYLQDASARVSRPDVEGDALSAQRQVLRHLLDPRVLERMSDAGFYGGDYPPEVMLVDLNDAVIGGDLTGQPDAIRRNAQITYIEALAALADDQRAKPTARTAAVAALRDVRGRLGLTDILMKPAAKAHRAHVRRILDEAGV